MTMTRTIVLGLLLLLTSPAWAMEHYINNLQDRHGEAIGGVTVTVYLAGTLTPATLFSDNAVTPKSNPFPSDSAGYYDFYAANGVYDFTFVRSGFTFPFAYARVALFDVNDGGIGGGSPTDDTLLIGNGTTWQNKTLPNGCATSSSKLLYDNTTNTFSCGTDLSGAATFDAIGSGSKTTATMTLATGASLTFSGSGTVNASTFKGNATIAAADGGTGQTSVTDDGLLVANGSVFQLKIIPNCINPTTDKLLYDASTNSLSCGVDQSAGGGTTFDTIGSGTNTTASMVLGSGSGITLTGTGVNAANTFWPNVTTVNAGNSPYPAVNPNATLLCDTVAAARIINLPPASGRNIFTVFNMGSNTCTINRAGADTITTGLSAGLTSFILRNAGSTFWLQPDGVNLWYVGG